MGIEKLRKKFKKLYKHKLGIHFARGVDSSHNGLIFLLATGDILSSAAEFVLLPMSMGATAFSTILIAAHEHKMHNKRMHRSWYHPANLLAVALTTLSFIAAVVCTFAGTAVFASLAPLLFTGAFSLEALHDLGAGCHAWSKYLKYKNTHPHKASKHYHCARECAISFVKCAFAVGGTVGLFVLHKYFAGAFGVIAGGIGTGQAIFKGRRAYHKAKLEMEDQSDIAAIMLENISYRNEDIVIHINELIELVIPANTQIPFSNDALMHQPLQVSDYDMIIPINELIELVIPKIAQIPLSNNALMHQALAVNDDDIGICMNEFAIPENIQIDDAMINMIKEDLKQFTTSFKSVNNQTLFMPKQSVNAEEFYPAPVPSSKRNSV